MSLRKWLEQGPFTLSLTSGFFGFYAHVGFVKALEEEGFVAHQYRGCSAGAIVSSLLASGESIEDLERLLAQFRREDFWDPQLGMGFLKGNKFHQILQAHLKSHFEHLEKPLVLSAFDIKSFKTTVFNSGSLSDAVWASCAIPLMFHPVKTRGRSYWDGGVFDPLAVHGVEPESRVLIHDITEKSIIGLPVKTKHLKNAQIVRLKQLPRSGPHKMHKGTEIIEQAYQQTRGLLFKK